MATGRVARIQITADTRDLAQKVEVARKLLGNLNRSDLAKPTRMALSKEAFAGLDQAAVHLNSRIVDLRKKIEGLSKATGVAFDARKVGAMVYEVNLLKDKLWEIKRLKTGDVTEPGAREDRGRAVAGGGGAGEALGWLKKIVAVGTIVGLFKHYATIAAETQPLRALAGIGGKAGPLGGVSGLGYTQEERRQEAAAFIRAPGTREMTQAVLTRRLDRAELLARAYGVSVGAQAGLTGAAQVGGMRGDVVGRTIAQARAQGMTGQQTVDYLEKMTGFLSEMADGVNIDDRSVNAISQVVGASSKFFTTNPARIFSALQGMNRAFTEGDRYQQAQAYRAILAGAPGVSPVTVALRQKLGLFGEPGPEMRKLFAREGTEGDRKAMAERGSDILKREFEENMRIRAGMTVGRRVFETAAALNVPEEMVAGWMNQIADVRAGKKGARMPDFNAKPTELTDEAARKRMEGEPEWLGIGVRNPKYRGRAAQGDEAARKRMEGEPEWLGIGVRNPKYRGRAAQGGVFDPTANERQVLESIAQISQVWDKTAATVAAGSSNLVDGFTKAVADLVNGLDTDKLHDSIGTFEGAVGDFAVAVKRFGDTGGVPGLAVRMWKKGGVDPSKVDIGMGQIGTAGF